MRLRRKVPHTTEHAEGQDRNAQLAYVLEPNWLPKKYQHNWSMLKANKSAFECVQRDRQRFQQTSSLSLSLRAGTRFGPIMTARFLASILFSACGADMQSE